MNFGKICVFVLLLCTLSCSNEDFQIDEVNGVVEDVSGIFGLEGCGFMIRINGELYKPTYLNRQYEEDGFEVLLNVEFLNSRADCSTRALAPREIRIEQIRPLN
ncbi:hypothetical protein [Roseivirga sp. E12]|uniref:hypothetical protein n=1 Tax=Roseivirga sp. E12 TaxID=2819237 RepID=UPI001ABC6510|nr:hypothetical protein [Roseivirga sp. E12]MBO3698849.1 hypothetical protein [Roseivirga sp. E12]